MKKKILPVLIVITLILVLSTIFAVSLIREHYEPTKETMDLSEYYKLSDSDHAAIVLDTQVSESQALLINGHPYVDFSYVREALNPRFYYDAAEQLLILAEGTDLMEVSPDSTEYRINGNPQSADNIIYTIIDDTCYVDIDFVQANSDISCSFYESPARLVIQVSRDETEQAAVTADTEIRYRGGIKSPILTNVSAGDMVTVHMRDEKWTEVASADGVIGYIPSSKISESSFTHRESSYTEKEHPHIFLNEPVSLIWHQVTNRSANRDIADTLDSIGNINVISPTWFYLDDNEGALVDYTSSNYVQTCHERGIQVWGLISNLENPDVSTSAVLGSTTIRRRVIDSLIASALACGMDGINVDFESLKADSIGDSFIQFIRELSLRCSENHLVLSVDNYVMSSFTAFYNRTEQAKFADYVIIMAYDEHYYGSDDGSVASLPWVEDGLVKTLEQVPSNQVILGNPFYTRIWKLSPKSGIATEVVDEEDHSETFDISSEVASMDAAQKTIAERNAEISWSDKDGQNFSQWEEGTTVYRVWLEDEISMKSRLQLIHQYELAGAAFWKLGFDNSSIWDVIDSNL